MSPPIPDADPRAPGDFAALLATPEPPLLVGGQAVNLWALHYEERTRDLAPFVSRDVDVLGERATLAALARVAGVRAQYFPLRPPSNEIGVVIARDPAGRPLLIEVLRYVHGVTNAELCDPTYTFALGEPGVPVRVPGPIALLQAKLANVADLKQEGRQDARQTLILARLLPAYLADLGRAAAAGRLEERRLLALLERLLATVTRPPAPRVLAELRIERRPLFAGLDATGLPKLAAFLEKRLPRALRGSEG